MNFECPNCHSSIELSGDQSAGSSICPVCGSELPHFAETVSVPKQQVGVFGRYTLERIAGQGKFGTVWEATDSVLGRVVALKIPRRIPKEPSERNIFLREARAAAALHHAAIVQIFDLGEYNGIPFIASEYVQGRTLAERLTKERLSRAEAVQLALQIAEALSYAHRQGVVHRDLKPGNILLDDQGRPKITDFGLAFISGGEDSIQSKGIVAGTPAYMSPEQARGGATTVDARTDIYALGVILYELLTGRRPFDSTSSSFFLQLQNVTPPSPRQFKPDLPDSIAAVVLRALEKRPEDRFATAQDFVEALRSAHAQVDPSADTNIASAIAAPASPKPLRQPAPSLRGPLTLLAATLATVVIASGAGYLYGIRLPGRSGVAIAKTTTDATSSSPKIPPTQISKNSEGVPTSTPGQGPQTPKEFFPDSKRIPCTIVTEPAGAHVVIWPLNPITWRPLLEEVIRPNETTSLDIDLLPGDYLIVAVLEDGRFHEVWRKVPEAVSTQGLNYKHRFWRYDNATRRLLLPRINLGDLDVTSNMTHFAGKNPFVMGIDGDRFVPDHLVRLPSFFLDTHEVTVSEFCELNEGHLPQTMFGENQYVPRAQEPIYTLLDDAIAHAERAGKRLMSEAEYEFAATNEGTTLYPWGDTFEAIGDWEFGPAGIPIADRTITEPQVFGLFSNVAEWTISRFEQYPGRRQGPLALPSPLELGFVGRHIVRGGDSHVEQRQPPKDRRWKEQGARMRNPADPLRLQTGIGFRCARSAKPHVNPEDFELELSE